MFGFNVLSPWAFLSGCHGDMINHDLTSSKISELTSTVHTILAGICLYKPSNSNTIYFHLTLQIRMREKKETLADKQAI